MDYRLSHRDGSWQLHLPDTHAEAAAAEIQAYEAEAAQNTEPKEIPLPPPTPPEQARKALWAAFWLTYTLAWFHLWLGAFDATNPLHTAAAAGGILFQEGGWWRPVTALTLHADLSHLVANILFLFCLAQALFRETGYGVGCFILLAAGTLGNVLAAAIASPLQRSVGASTMGFAALGCLSFLQSVSLHRRLQRWKPVWKRAWIPLAAGLAMLGIMGTSPNSDLSAHLFGFAAGIILTAPLALAPGFLRKIPDRVQLLLAILTALLVAIAWQQAFHAGI